MQRLLWRLCCAALVAGCAGHGAFAQKSFTWQEIREKFVAANPTLLAGQLNIDESKAQEVTAYLRPNPDYTLTTDGTQIAPNHGVWQPFAGTLFTNAFSYLHERDHKRELRRDAARGNTTVAQSNQADLERNLLFNVRQAFVQTLQAKAVLALARENLTYYDRLLQVNRERLKAGDIARVDEQRLELQRVQFESDLQTAEVNLRTAKIQLLQFLNERTPVNDFDITGKFEFSEIIPPLQELRDTAGAARPDLQAAIQSVDLAKISHQLAVANGSTDPTFSAWWSYNPSFANPNANETIGASVTIPLRIFDKNQGEKARTAIDIRRNERLRDAAAAQVFKDVDSAYETLNSTLALLKPYKTTYLQLATSVRETVSFSYQHGAASLLDFLQAQNDYRSVQVSYLNLVGSYLLAAAQLNLAVGREVIQ